MIVVARTIYQGMDWLHYSEREILFMTPRKFYLMIEAYRRVNKIRDRREEEIKDFL